MISITGKFLSYMFYHRYNPNYNIKKNVLYDKFFNYKIKI